MEVCFRVGWAGLLLCLASQPLFAQKTAEAWADSLLARLSRRAQLAQLLLLEAKQLDSSNKHLRRYGLGGVLHPTVAQDQGTDLWRADSLRLFPSRSHPPCAEERLLLATTDTLFLQQQGRWRAATYLQAGINLLYTGQQPCVQSKLQEEAFAHYLKGIEAAGLRCLKGQLRTAEALQLSDSLPLARSQDYSTDFSILRKRRKKNFSRKELRAACRRVLVQKYRHVVAKRPSPLRPPSEKWQRWQRLQAALTLLRNQHKTLPLQGLDTLQLASISIIPTPDPLPFRQRLQDYFEMPQYSVAPYTPPPLISSLTPYTYLILSLYPSPETPFSKSQLALIDSLQQQTNVIWVYFGEASGLNDFPQLGLSRVLLLARENSSEAQDLAAQALFGGIGLRGQLTTPLSSFFTATSLMTQANGSLSFVPPEALELDTEQLHARLSNIVEEALDAAAFPGCQLLLAKDGRVFFQKSYGYHTYQQQTRVTKESIYDLASMTKAMGPTTALMRLYGEGRFSPDALLSDYLPKWRRSDKGQLDFRSMLAHHSGLYSWIPYYKELFKKNGKPRRRFLSKKRSRRYPTALGNKLYLRKNYKKYIYKQINKSELSERTYKYSGLVFYLLPEIIERLSGERYAAYLRSQFYAPLGAKTLTFLPLSRFSSERLVPTEEDNFFRMQLLQGVVHDEGAAVMGGISGNAGLFGKAVDVAKLWQMYLQGGYYGGRRYLEPAAIEHFTACQFCEEENRRGLGFDRPPPSYEANNSPVARQASQNSFGHTGFTGTIAWADARYGLLFVFLCNRVHPTRSNPEIYIRNIRPRIHEAAYDLLCISEE